MSLPVRPSGEYNKAELPASADARMHQEPSYFLSTERLGFRRWRLEDLPLARELWGDPEVTRLIGGPFSEEQIRERLSKEVASMQEHGLQYWPVFLLSDADFVGCCGLRPYRSEKRIFELGFHFRPAYWGKGLAVESAKTIVQFAGQSLSAEGLFAGHHPENLASHKVLLKLGFRLTHEERYPPTGEMHRCYFLDLQK
jgi:[ribosomal protein S5]-alanine N-acetyltransferase